MRKHHRRRLGGALATLLCGAAVIIATAAPSPVQATGHAPTARTAKQVQNRRNVLRESVRLNAAAAGQPVRLQSYIHSVDHFDCTTGAASGYIRIWTESLTDLAAGKARLVYWSVENHLNHTASLNQVKHYKSEADGTLNWWSNDSGPAGGAPYLTTLTNSGNDSLAMNGKPGTGQPLVWSDVPAGGNSGELRYALPTRSSFDVAVSLNSGGWDDSIFRGTGHFWVGSANPNNEPWWWGFNPSGPVFVANLTTQGTTFQCGAFY
jgi:hypothetical protein